MLKELNKTIRETFMLGVGMGVMVIILGISLAFSGWMKGTVEQTAIDPARGIVLIALLVAGLTGTVQGILSAFSVKIGNGWLNAVVGILFLPQNFVAAISPVVILLCPTIKAMNAIASLPTQYARLTLLIFLGLLMALMAILHLHNQNLRSRSSRCRV